MAGLPRYWEHETGGALRRAMEAYLLNAPMTAEQITVMRSYLHQWIMADAWEGGSRLELLRAEVFILDTREAIDAWLARALELEIDPL